MRIDLHCHTKKVKTGDAYTRNVTKDKFFQKVIEAEVKIIAITNHNQFDYMQYKEFKDVTEGYCDIWPGVELDIIAFIAFQFFPQSIISLFGDGDEAVFSNCCFVHAYLSFHGVGKWCAVAFFPVFLPQ